MYRRPTSAIRIAAGDATGPRTVSSAVSSARGSNEADRASALRLLRHLGLVTGDRNGRHIHYTLFDDHVTELLDEAIGHLEHLPRGA